MKNGYGANQYKQTSVTTATPGQILIMLYEAAIKNVKKASECIRSGDVPGKGVAIVKTHDIINELVNTLDFDVGGDVARELERLYNFIIDQLVLANRENRAEPLQSVQKILETLLVGWKGAVEQVTKQGPGTQGSAK